MRNLSTTIFVVLLLLTPAAIWVEDTYPDFWQSQLFTPTSGNPTPAPGKHVTEGTVLTGHLQQNHTLTKPNSPYILVDTLTVPPNTTLTIEPGTQVFADRRAAISIAGTFNALGTVTNPILFTSNELSPTDQTWHGITINDQARATLQHVTIEHASPAVSCLANSNVTITNTTIQASTLGIYTESPACTITDSIVRNTTDGIITRGVSPQLTNTSIAATRNDILEK